MESGFKSGFVAIVGRPNVGKSTLLNFLVKKKIAIVSEKPQTTRHKIRAIFNAANAQLVLIDTPGFHKPKDALGERLNEIVRSTMKEVDGIVFMVDASQTIGTGDQFIANELARLETPVVVALNKTDLLEKPQLQAQVEVAERLGDFKAFIPVSSTTGENVERLVEALMNLIPEGPQYYPEGMLTDQPEQILVAEFIREQVLALTREEVPHSVAVEVQEMQARKNRELIDIFATIFVERESQKGILVGKGGGMLKEIGQRARQEIELLLGSQIYLDLRVRVRKDWKRDTSFIRRFGLE